MDRTETASILRASQQSAITDGGRANGTARIIRPSAKYHNQVEYTALMPGANWDRPHPAGFDNYRNNVLELSSGDGACRESVQKGYGVLNIWIMRKMAVELVIPKSLTKNVTDEWGDAGKAWLQRLPDLLLECRDLWALQLHQSSFPLSYNYVTEVTLDDGTNAILKVGFPQDELFNEMKVLQLLNGRCTAKLLQADEKLGAFLLERIEPGTPLASIQRTDDEQATSIAAPVLKEFPIAAPEGMLFPTISDWGNAFERVKQLKGNPLSIAVLDKASDLLIELDQSTAQSMLLHGDLHHHNILFDQRRGWLSIDPKGVVGDPLFNAARLLNNPRPSALGALTLLDMDNPAKVVHTRLEILAQTFNADISRLAAWAFVDCILSACWWVESGGQTCNFSLRCAEIFDRFL